MNLPKELFREQTDVNRILYLYSFDYLQAVETHEKSQILSFWKKSTLNYCLYNKTLTVSYTNLSKFYEIYDIEPTSLRPAYKDMVLLQELVSTFSPTSTEVALSWAKYLGSYVFPVISDVSNSQTLICAPAVQFLVESILLKYAANLSDKDRCFYVNETAHIHKTFSFREFVSQAITHCKGNPQQTVAIESTYAMECLRQLDKGGLLVLVDYMIKSNQASLLDNGAIIYIGRPNSTIGDSICDVKDKQEISLAFLKIRNSVLIMQERIETSNHKITHYLNSAREYKTKGDIKMALLQLKLKKSVVDARDMLSASLYALKDAAERMESMSDMALIRDAYITATSGLKSMRVSAGLSVESVEEARDVLTQELELQEEISDTLTQPLSVDQVDDDELLKELDNLMSASNSLSTVNIEVTSKAISATDELDVSDLLPDLSNLTLSDIPQVNHNNDIVNPSRIKESVSLHNLV